MTIEIAIPTCLIWIGATLACLFVGLNVCGSVVIAYASGATLLSVNLFIWPAIISAGGAFYCFVRAVES